MPSTSKVNIFVSLNFLCCFYCLLINLIVNKADSPPVWMSICSCFYSLRSAILSGVPKICQCANPNSEILLGCAMCFRLLLSRINGLCCHRSTPNLGHDGIEPRAVISSSESPSFQRWATHIPQWATLTILTGATLIHQWTVTRVLYWASNEPPIFPDVTVPHTLHLVIHILR